MENKVTQEKITRIMDASLVQVETIFDKCTVVTVKLPNGFILTESSACVDPANYDVEMGKAICYERIENKIWELEGYVLQSMKDIADKLPGRAVKQLEALEGAELTGVTHKLSQDMSGETGEWNTPQEPAKLMTSEVNR